MGKNRWLFTTLTRGLRRYRTKAGDEIEKEEAQKVVEPAVEVEAPGPIKAEEPPVVKPKPVVSVFSDTAYVIQEGKPIYMPSIRTIKKYKANYEGYIKGVSHNDRMRSKRIDWIAHTIVDEVYELAGHKGQLLSTRAIAMFENVQRYIDRTGLLDRPLVIEIDGNRYRFD